MRGLSWLRSRRLLAAPLLGRLGLWLGHGLRRCSFRVALDRGRAHKLAGARALRDSAVALLAGRHRNLLVGNLGRYGRPWLPDMPSRRQPESAYARRIT